MHDEGYLKIWIALCLKLLKADIPTGYIFWLVLSFKFSDQLNMDLHFRSTLILRKPASYGNFFWVPVDCVRRFLQTNPLSKTSVIVELRLKQTSHYFRDRHLFLTQWHRLCLSLVSINIPDYKYFPCSFFVWTWLLFLGLLYTRYQRVVVVL